MKPGEGVTEDTNTDLVIFHDAGQLIEVTLDAPSDTVWLTRRRMGALFETTPENVLIHLRTSPRVGVVGAGDC